MEYLKRYFNWQIVVGLVMILFSLLTKSFVKDHSYCNYCSNGYVVELGSGVLHIFVSLVNTIGGQSFNACYCPLAESLLPSSELSSGSFKNTLIFPIDILLFGVSLIVLGMRKARKSM